MGPLLYYFQNKLSPNARLYEKVFPAITRLRILLSGHNLEPDLNTLGSILCLRNPRARIFIVFLPHIKILRVDLKSTFATPLAEYPRTCKSDTWQGSM